MNELKLYFKVYQDKEYMDDYYVDTPDNIMNICNDRGFILSEELPPVFEPIYMTEEQFNSLPEFKGF